MPGAGMRQARKEEIGGKGRPWSVLLIIIHLKAVKKKVRMKNADY
jgi:hypothetical protein